MPTKTTFIIIERPLLPSPPRNSRPYWCLVNTLIFYSKKGVKELWRQKIPEANMRWMKGPHGGDEFDKYFHSEVFYDKHFGWQLRMTISHEKAAYWHKKMLRFIDNYHREHFKKLETKAK